MALESMGLELAIAKALADGSAVIGTVRPGMDLSVAALSTTTANKSDSTPVPVTTGVDDIINELNNGRSSLLKLIECLGPILTHAEPFQRASGVALLSTVISQTETSKISAQSATVLSQFYLSRLDDQPSVEPVLNGLLAMVSLSVLSKEEKTAIPARIFSELNVQSFQQSVRQTVFRLFAKLFETNLDGLHELGSEFVFGFIHAMDGEKDPRILILAFRIAQLIIKHLDFSKHAEDLFEVVFCYFPITFRPIPGDPYGVTAEDLKHELCATVAATPLFAPFAVPVLLEKLSSDSAAAKRDAMDAVSACAPVYEGASFSPYIDAFWDALKKEIVSPVEPANELSSLMAIRALVKSLSTAISISQKRQSPLEKMIDIILKDCLENLADPDLKFAKPCGKIMMSAASASEPACNIIVEKALPVILNALSNEDAPSKRKTLADVLGDFLVAGRSVYSSKNGTSDDLMQTPLKLYCEQLFDFFMPCALSDLYVPLKLSSLRGLTEMLLSRNLLGAKEECAVLELVLSWMLEDPNTQIHSVALETITSISAEIPDLVQNVVLEPLLNALKAAQTEFNVLKMESALVSCFALSKNKQMRSVILSALIDIFVSAATSTLESHPNMPYILAYERRTLQIVAEILLESSTQPIMLTLDQTHTCELIFKLVLTSVNTAPAMDETMKNEIVCLVAKVVALMIRSLDVPHQSQIIKELKHSFQSFNSPVVLTDPVYAYLTAAVMTNVSSKTPFDILDLEVYSNELINMSIQLDGLYALATSKILASIVNKGHGVQGIDAFVTHFCQTKCDSALVAVHCTLPQRQTILKIYSWIAKALVVKADPRGYQMTLQILGLLSNADLGLAAADAINVLISDDSQGVLTKMAGANIKMLYKQRLYNYCLPIVSSGFQVASDGSRNAYLYSLSHLLHNVSKGVLLSELPKLLPMLLHSLTLNETTLKLGTLDTLQQMVKDAPAVLESQISSIMTLLLPMCLFKNANQGNDARVRVSAIAILGLLMSWVNYTVLHPFKPRVLQELAYALDDPKRVVRKEAANTRSIWFMPQPT
ncbi:hypothetical protein BDV3_004648 [Batrachochytrium dendrobatidis]